MSNSQGTLTMVLLVTLVSATPPGGRLDSPAWVMLPTPPSPLQGGRGCPDHSALFWSVSLTQGHARAKPLTIREHVDPIPFKYAEGENRRGNRHVARVDDGWLVGFDEGEFGGGLWWFSDRADHKSRPIHPSSSSPSNPSDIFHAENVLGLPMVGGQRLVLMGLDHMTGRSGRVFRAVAAPTGWELAPVAVLDAQPDVWLVDGSRLLFLTESGLWVSDGFAARRVHAVDLGNLTPTSMVRAADGAVYVGMRYYVLRLAERGDVWEESWFVPASCQKMRFQEWECECLP